MALTSEQQPLVATSPSGLVALTNTASNSSSIRCYDSNSNALKFTLRIPKRDDNNEEFHELSKLVFANDAFLVGHSRSNAAIIWDINRGISSHIINLNGTNETLADLTVSGSKMYLLAYHGSPEKVKVRVLQYECDTGSLEKKIKVGSARSVKLALAVSGVTGGNAQVMAVRLGGVIKLCDLNGDKLDKVDSPINSIDVNHCVLKYSNDGSHLLASSEGKIILFRLVKEKKLKLHPMTVLRLDDGSVDSLDIRTSDKSIAIIVFQYGVKASYYILPSSKKSSSLDGMAPISPTATMQTKIEQSLLSSTFHPLHNNEILFVFRNTSNAPGSGTTLPTESLSCNIDDEDDVTGTITLSPPPTSDEKNKKRKAACNGAMAPGETGTEASITTDLTSMTKKEKGLVEALDEDGNDLIAGGDEDEFELDEDVEDGGGVGTSIAERLAMLSSAMEQTTDEEEDFDEDDNEVAQNKKQQLKVTKAKFSAKTATSESLTTLLTQALSSNDSIQLNIALQVTEPRLVENTVKALQVLDAQRDDPNNTEGYVPMLMGHIVRRMARRHTLVTPLMSWIKAILLASSQVSSRSLLQGSTVTEEEEERMAREGRELASKLGPLRNFLNERVECFPQLLRLEGRLALLGQQL